MTEDQLHILQAQIIDLNTKVKKIRIIDKFIDTVKAKKYETFLAIVLLLAIAYATYDIKQHITIASIKNAYAIKAQIRDTCHNKQIGVY